MKMLNEEKPKSKEVFLSMQNSISKEEGEIILVCAKDIDGEHICNIGFFSDRGFNLYHIPNFILNKYDFKQLLGKNRVQANVLNIINKDTKNSVSNKEPNQEEFLENGVHICGVVKSEDICRQIPNDKKIRKIADKLAGIMGDLFIDCRRDSPISQWEKVVETLANRGIRFDISE